MQVAIAIVNPNPLRPANPFKKAMPFNNAKQVNKNTTQFNIKITGLMQVK